MKIKDLIGQRFERLLVIEIRPSDSKGHAHWLVRCDCKNEFVVKSQSLRNGNTKSCGCFKKDHVIASNKARALPSGEGCFNFLFKNYRNEAKRRHLVFRLTKKQFRDLTKGSCYYCGDEPKQEFKRTTGYNGSYFYNGLDRLKNDIGYTRKNSVSCCGTCNKMKHCKSVQDFLQACQAVVDHQSKRLGESAAH